MLAPRAAAQTTFRACRVPSVGVIYMIGVSGAPSACLDASHVEFSWTEGGVPPDGSVTTPKLADNAVTSAKIADGTILVSDVDPTSIQARVAAVCTAGSSIRAIGANGSVTCQVNGGNVAGSQITGFSGSVNITGTTAVQLHSLSIPGSSAGVATVTAHAYVEKDATTTGRYEFTLRTGTCSGPIVGVAWWRPLTAVAGFNAETVALTGTVTGANAATTIVLCGAKFDSDAPTATVYLRGLIAHW
jgi:hypothetical protein